MRRLPLVLLALGCHARDPLADAPPGAWMVGSAAAVAPLAERLAAWSGTVIGARARPVAAQVATCPDQVLLALLPDATSPTVSCTVPDTWAPLAAAAEGHAAAFLLPDAGIGRFSGTVDVSPDGAFVATGSLPDPPGGTAWDLLLPDDGDPGPDVLPSDGALVHARVRQARVADIATLSGPSAGDEDVFGLNASLFASSVLSGTWEFVAWPPADGGRVPGAALAVGTRSETIAGAAAEQYVATLSKRWPFVATPTDAGGHAATCLTGLNLLPELTPCWAIAQGNLVVAWNAASLARAFGVTTHHAATSEVVVHFSAFPAADAALTRAFAPPGAPPPADTYPWRDLALTTQRVQGRVQVTLTGVAR